MHLCVCILCTFTSKCLGIRLFIEKRLHKKKKNDKNYALYCYTLCYYSFNRSSIVYSFKNISGNSLPNFVVLWLPVAINYCKHKKYNQYK